MRCLFSVDWSILKFANNENYFHSQLPIWVTNKLSTILAPKMVKRLHKTCLNYPKWKVGEKMASFNYHQCAQQQNIKSIEPGQTNRVSLRTCISRIRNLGFIRSRFKIISLHANHDFSSFQKLGCSFFPKQWYFCPILFSQISGKRIVLTDCEDSEESGENTPTEVDFGSNICNKWIYMGIWIYVSNIWAG